MIALISPLDLIQLNSLLLLRRKTMKLNQICLKLRSFVPGLLLLALTFVALSAVAQDETVPKFDIFGGYQYLSPQGDTPVPGTSNPVQALTLTEFGKGFGLAGAYNYNRYLALES